MTVIFKVSDVAVGGDRLPPSPAHEVFRQRGVAAIEAFALNAPTLVDEPPLHGFLLATHLAFAHHLPLTISPDDVWLCVAQGFAHHVAAAGEALRHRLVRHEGQIELLVDRPDFFPGNPRNDWPGVADELTAMMGAHMSFQRDLVTETFSTSGPIERAAARVTLMASMQGFFRYVVCSLCGIPAVTLLGEVADWERLRARAELLGEFDLRWWMDALLPALDLLVASSRGAADRSRWESFYKHQSASGGDLVGGWINALLPYVLGADGRYDQRNPWIVAGTSALKTDQLPLGIVAAPFEWRFPFGSLDMRFGAGFIGATQETATGAVRAVQGWWVADQKKQAEFLERARGGAGFRGRQGPWTSPVPVREAPPPPDVDVVIENDRTSVDLRDLLPTEGVRSVTIRGASALESLAGIPDVLESLVVEDAPRLRDIDVMAFCSKVTLVRCGALEDLRWLHVGARDALTIAECPLVADEWQGSYSGRALFLWKQRHIRRFGRR